MLSLSVLPVRPLSPSEREEFEGPRFSDKTSGRGSGSDLYDTFRRDPLALLEIERMERERLERLLRIERELHARGRDELDRLYGDPVQMSSTSRSKFSDSWRDLDYGRPRREYSPPTYGGSARRSPPDTSSSYHSYGLREKTSPSHYGGYGATSSSSSTSYPSVGYHGADKPVGTTRDSYSATYGSGTGYSGHTAVRGQLPTGYDSRSTSASAWGNGSSVQTYGLMGDSPAWK